MARKTVEGRSAGQRSRPSDVARSTDVRNVARRPASANALTAILDREGMVLAVIAGRVEARAFLRGGCA